MVSVLDGTKNAYKFGVENSLVLADNRNYLFLST